MRRLLFAALLAAAHGARADECKPDCRELPRMEKELFAQETLQEYFTHYVSGIDRVPSQGMIDDPDHPGKMVPETLVEALQRQAQDQVNGDQKKATGAKGEAHAEAGTDAKCNIRLYSPDGKTTKPFDEKQYRKDRKCWEADFVLAHEGQHVADCKGGFDNLASFENYAAGDVRAYGVGIRNLRKSLAETATRCHWKGSFKKDGTPSTTKKNPIDKKDEPVVPTAADIKNIVDALPPAPKKGGK